MNDREFWDSYLSSMEELNEDPPPEVKEAIFRRMRRSQMRRKWGKRVASTLGVLLLLGSGGLFLAPLDKEDPIAENGINVWDPSIPGLGTSALTENGATRKRDANTNSSEKGPEKNMEHRSRTASPDMENEKPRSEIKGMESRNIEGQKEEGKQILEEKSQALEASSEGEKVPKDPSSSERKGTDGALASSSSEEKPSRAKGGRERIEPLPRIGTNVEEPKLGNGVAVKALEKDEEGSSFVQSVFVGSDLAFNFTRLMDRRTLKSFEATSLVSTQGDLNFDKSITLGLSFSDRTRLVGRFFMNEEIGQNYQRYLEGRYLEQRIQLSYRSYGALIEHDVLQNSYKPGHRSFLSVYGGVDLATLRQAERMDEGKELSVEKNFRDHAIGLNAGLRAGTAFRNGLDIGLLFGASGSLTELGKEASSRSVSKGGSRSVAGSIGLSLRYHFGDRFGATSP